MLIKSGLFLLHQRRNNDSSIFIYLAVKSKVEED